MQKDKNLQLVIYEGGQSFHINKALFSEDELDIEKEERPDFDIFFNSGKVISDFQTVS